MVRGAVAELVAHENDVHDNEGAGVLLLGAGCNPLLEKNRLRNNATEGVRVERGAAGRLMRNVIADNGGAGIFCEVGCEPTLGDNFQSANEKEMKEMEEMPALEAAAGGGDEPAAA